MMETIYAYIILRGDSKVPNIVHIFVDKKSIHSDCVLSIMYAFDYLLFINNNLCLIK